MAKQNSHDDDAVDPSGDDSDPNKTKRFDTVEGDDEFDLASVDSLADDSDPNKTKKFDASKKTVEGDDEFDLASVDSLADDSDPNKTKKFDASKKTVEGDDEFELASVDSSADDRDPNKTKKFDASKKTVEGDDEFEIGSVDPSADDSDPNKTKKFDVSSKTVEGDDEFEIGSVDPEDSGESSEQLTPDLATGKEGVGLQTVVLGTGQTFTSDSAGDLETGEDLNEKTITGPVDRPILPGTMMVDDIAPLLSSEFDQSFDSSQDLGDSQGSSVGSANRAWGKQSTNVTPMSSIEAPLRSRRTMVRPKLNDRLVVADGEAETVGNPDYRIISFLGAGAMGEVYIARQTSVDRDVAFKKQILKKKESRRKMIRNRDKFLFEAQVTANLDHPNIVGIHDMGRDQNGDVFYCMELVRGEPWEDVIRKMTLKDNLEVLLKVIDGVAYAHSKDTIHRDLKPENTMLGEFGEVLIMDWGLGVNLSNGPPQTMGGTPGFMAPEMATREDIVGKHSDIYLLGAILFVITTGQTPHTGTDVWKCLDNAKINRIVDVSNSPKQFDKRLLAIAHKAMATDPRDRYANPEQLRSAIENYQSNQLSIELAERSEVELKLAVEDQDYEFFSKSMFGFRESVSLWKENAVAKSGLQRAKIGYATCALERQDFELGMSLLDPKVPQEAPLYQKLRKGAAASNQRRRLVWLAVGASVLLLAALVLTSMLAARTQRLNAENLAVSVKQEKKATATAEEETKKAIAATEKAIAATQREAEERKKAVAATKIAQEQTKKAESATKIAKEEKRKAEAAAASEAEEKKKALAATKIAKEEKKKAESATQTAKEEKKKAESATKEAVNLAGELRTSETSARQRLFQSNIGLIDGYIRDNQIEQAINTLNSTRSDDSRFVNWEWNRLYHLCHTEVKSESLEGATAIDQSDDGTVAIISSLGMAKFWNPNRNLAATAIEVANGKAISTSLSSDGRWAAIGTADPDRKLTIWDVKTGKMVANLSDDISASLVSCVAFNKRGTQLAVGDSTRLITLFNGNGQNWTATKKLGFHSKRPVDLDFSSDGKRLASVSLAGLSIVWDTTTGDPLSAFAHRSKFHAVKFQPGTNGMVACATDDQEIVFWNSSIPNNPESWQNLSTRDLNVAKSRCFVNSLVAHETVVNDVDFSSNGRTIVTCGDDRTIAVWNSKDRTLRKRFRGHVNAVGACCVVKDGNSAVSASADGEVRSWRFDEYEDQRVFSSEQSFPINCVQFNAQATQLLTGDEDGVIRIWNREKSARVASKLDFDPKLGRKAVYLPVSDRIVTSSPGNVFVWKNGKRLHKKTEVGESGIVVVSKNERMMVTGGDTDQPTIVWDLETGNKLATLLTGNSRNRVTAMAISPDDRYLAIGTGSVEGIVSVFNLESFQLVDEFEMHRGWITDLVFSPASNEFLSADSVEGYVNAWIIEGNQVRRQKKIEGIGGSYIRIAYNESGDNFATSTNTDTSKSEMQIWDSRTKNSVSKVQLARPIDFVSFISDEVVFRLTNGKAYGWKHEKGPRQMRHVPIYSNASYPTALNGWTKLSGGKSLVYGDGFVKIIDGSAMRKTEKSRSNPIASVLDSAGNPGPCITTLFADEERQVVALYRDGAVRFWDRKTNAVTNVIQPEKSSVTGIDVLKTNSRRLATCDSVGVIRSIDVETNKTLVEIDTKIELQAIKWYGPEAVIVASSEGLMRVDLNSKKVVKLVGTTEKIAKIDASEAGNVVVAVGLNRKNEGSVYLWQQEDNGQWQKQPNVFGSQVLSAKVSPDGKRVFSGDAAGGITVWYIPEPGSSDPPRKLISLLGHEKEISAIALSEDGSQVASSSNDGSAILWLSAEARK